MTELKYSFDRGPSKPFYYNYKGNSTFNSLHQIKGNSTVNYLYQIKGNSTFNSLYQINFI